MTNSFQSHKPNYMSEFDEPQQAFDTLEQLLELPQPKRFQEATGFKRFTRTEGPSDRWGMTLMGEFDDGKFWVVGFTEKPVDGLEPWIPPGGAP